MRYIICFFALIVVMQHGVAQTKNYIDQPYVEVDGFADSLVIPNQIFIKIVLSEKDTKGKMSLEELESKMIQDLKSLGLNTEEVLALSDFTSNYKYYLLKSKDVQKEKNYVLEVATAEMVTKVFLKLETLGVGNTSIDRVSHKEIRKIENLVRTKAIEDAKLKALALTKPLNQSVGLAIYIVEKDKFTNNLSSVVVRKAKRLTYDNETIPSIEFEKINVSVKVDVKFVLK